MNENESIASYIIRELKTNQKRMFIFLVLYFVVSSAILVWSIIDSVQMRDKMNTLLKDMEIIEKCDIDVKD